MTTAATRQLRRSRWAELRHSCWVELAATVDQLRQDLTVQGEDVRTWQGEAVRQAGKPYRWDATP